MGNFYTSTQILNAKPLSKEDFLKKFCEAMKREGYAACETGEGEKEYAFSFSDEKGCRWATLYSESYEEGNQTAKADTARIAGMLGTFCINTTVIDSDCAILELYDKSGSKVDNLIMGRADDYFGDNIPEPERALWEPLLNNGVSWEQFIEIVHGDYVFVEEGLAKLSVVLNNGSMFSEVLESDCSMAFEKARPKITVTSNGKTIDSDKKVTIYSAFEDIFKNDLEALGFKKAKLKKPVFIKLINEEVIAVITCEKQYGTPQCTPEKTSYGLPMTMTPPPDWFFAVNYHEHFNVLLNFFTVYDNEIYFKVNTRYDSGFYDNRRLYINEHLLDCDLNYANSIWSFTYQPDNGESINAAMLKALEISRKHLIPASVKFSDLKALILGCRSYWCSPIDDKLYFAIDDCESFFLEEWDTIEKYDAIKCKTFKNFSQKDMEKRRKSVRGHFEKRRDSVYAIKNDEKKLQKVLQDLENVKTKNLSELKRIGVN